MRYEKRESTLSIERQDENIIETARQGVPLAMKTMVQNNKRHNETILELNENDYASIGYHSRP